MVASRNRIPWAMETNDAEDAKYWKKWIAVGDFALTNENILKTIVQSMIMFCLKIKCINMHWKKVDITAQAFPWPVELVSCEYWCTLIMGSFMFLIIFLSLLLSIFYSAGTLQF